MSKQINYRGIKIGDGWQFNILYAQFITDYIINNKKYKRIPYGEESWFSDEHLKHCPDCGCLIGELHVLHCDTEECPKCKIQALRNKCNKQYEDYNDNNIDNVNIGKVIKNY